MRLITHKYQLPFNGFYDWSNTQKSSGDFFLDNISECISDANQMLAEEVAKIISSCDSEIVSIRLNKDLPQRAFVLELGVRE